MLNCHFYHALALFFTNKTAKKSSLSIIIHIERLPFLQSSYILLLSQSTALGHFARLHHSPCQEKTSSIRIWVKAQPLVTLLIVIIRITFHICIEFHFISYNHQSYHHVSLNASISPNCSLLFIKIHHIYRSTLSFMLVFCFVSCAKCR